MPDITTLADYGLAGVFIALIILIGFIVNRIFKLMGNHMSHETDAWNRNTEILSKLSTKIDQDIKISADTTRALEGLKMVIKTKLK